MSGNNIQVAIKARPLLKREKEQKMSNFWKIVNNSIHLEESNAEPFYFDHIFDEAAQNENIFSVLGKPIVDKALEGFNGTIFAYGQTASGKTYTMLGDDDNPGVMVLAAKEIFSAIERASDRAFLIRVGYIELYNEKVFDLLNLNNHDLKIHETAAGEVSVNCTEFIITSEQELIDYLRMGSSRRIVKETNMNARSSRSHAIFRIIIESREMEQGAEENCVQISHLNLVDLAGSERAVQTGATGSRLKEGGHINKSLLFLSCVIKQLSENESGFINYRDSKLTRILQASLGGNALTAIICTINPTVIDETQSTLNFAMRAKSIKNKPRVNEVLSDSAMMKRLEKEISRLQSELAIEKTKNSKIKVVQLERQIKDEGLKILHSHSLAPAKSSYNSRRRRTWCPSGSLDTSDTCIKTDFKPPPEPVMPSARSNLPLPRKFFTPQIFSRGELPPIHSDTNDEDFVPSHKASFLKTLGEEDFQTPPKAREMRVAETKASLTPRMDIVGSYKKIERELNELKEFTNLESHLEVEHQQVVDFLKDKLEKAEQQILELKAEKMNSSNCSDKLHEAETKLEDAELKCAQLETRITDLDNIAQASQDIIDEYVLKIANLTQKVSQLELENREAVSLEFEFQRHRNKAKLREDDLLSVVREKDTQIATLEKQLESLSAERLRASKEDLSELSQQGGEVCVKCVDLERILAESKQFESDCERAKLELRELQLDLEEKKRDLDETSNKCVEYQEKIKVLENSLKEAEVLRAGVKETEAEIEGLSSKLKESTLQLEELQKELQTKTLELESGRKEGESNNKLVLRLKEIEESGKSESSALKAKIEQLERDLEEKTQKFTEANTKCVEYQQIIKDSENSLKEIEVLRSRVKETESEIEELSTKLKESAVQLTEVQKELESGRKEGETSNELVLRLKERLCEAESAQEQATSDLSKKKTEIEEFASKLKESEDLRQELEQVLERKSSEWEDKYKSSENNLKESEEHREELKLQLAESEDNSKALKEKLNEAEKIREQTAADLNATIADLTLKLNESEDFKHKLEEAQVVLKNQTLELETSLKLSEESCKALKEELNATQKTLEQTTKDLNNKITEIEHFEQRLIDSQKELDKLKECLSEQDDDKRNESILRDMETLHDERQKLQKAREDFAKEIEREKHDLIFEQELFRKERDETQMQLENYEKVNFDLTFENEGLNVENRNLLAEQDKMIAECQVLRSDCEKIQTQYNTVFAQYDQIRSENDELKVYCDGLKTHNDELQAELVEVKGKIEMIQEKLTADVGLEAVQAELVDLEAKYQSAVMERDNLQKELNAHVEESKVVRERYEDAKRMLATSEEQTDIIQKENDNMLLGIDDMRKIFESIERSALDAASQNENLLEKGDKRKNRVEELIIDHRVLINDWQALKDCNSGFSGVYCDALKIRLDIEKLQNKQKALFAELTRLVQEIETEKALQTCKAEVKAVNERLSEVESDYESTSTELMDNLQENEELKAKCASLEEQLKAQKSSRLSSISEDAEVDCDSALRKEITELQERANNDLHKISNLKNQVEASEAELKRLSKENAELHLVITSATANAEELLAENSLLSKNVANLKQTNEELSIRLDLQAVKYNEEIDGLKEKISQKETDQNKYNEEIGNLKATITDIEAKKESNEELRAELASNKEIIDELKSQIQQLYAMKELQQKNDKNRVQEFLDNLKNAAQIEIMAQSGMLLFTAEAEVVRTPALSLVFKEFENILEGDSPAAGHIKDLYFELREVSEVTNRRQKQIEQLQSEIEVFTSERDNLRKQLNDLDKEVRNLSGKLAEMEVENLSLVREKTEIAQRFKNIEAEVVEKHSEVDSLTKQMSDAKKTAEQAEEKASELSEQLERVLSDKQEAIAKLSEVENHAQKSWKELKTAERLVLQLQEEVTVFNEERESFKQLESEKRLSMEKLEDLRKSLADFENEKQSLTQEVEEKNQQISKLEAENAALVKERNDLISNRSDNIDQLGQIIAEMEQQAKELSAKYDALLTENEQRKTELNAAAKRNHDLSKQNEQCKSEMNEAVKRNQELTAEVHALKEYLKEGKREVDLITKELETLKAANNELKSGLSQAQGTVESLKAEKDQLNAQLQTKDNHYQKIVKEFEKRNATLASEKKTLQAQLQSMGNESKLRISALEGELQDERKKWAEQGGTAKVELSPKRTQIIETLVGENNHLKLKNQDLLAELDAAQRSTQSERRSKRHSTHDERRRQSLWDYSKDASTMTLPTDKSCNCEELNEKLNEIKKKLIIRESQVNTLSQQLKSNPLKDEVQTLKSLLLEEEEKQLKMRYEIKKLRLTSQERQVCAKCASESKRVFASSTTQTTNDDEEWKPASVKVERDLVKVEPDSMKVERDSDSPIEREYKKLLSKYEDLKNICRTRFARIVSLEEELSSKGKENQSGNTRDKGSEFEALKTENKVLRKKYEESKLMLNVRFEEIKKLKGSLGLSTK